jgi:LPS O-antigen subunit length determinant protein (WzzB/FepE family)
MAILNNLQKPSNPATSQKALTVMVLGLLGGGLIGFIAAKY